MAVRTDIGNPENGESLRDAAIRAFGRIDVWIKNVGLGAMGLFGEFMSKSMNASSTYLKGLI